MPNQGRQPPESEDVPLEPRQIPDVPTPPYAKAVNEAWIVEGMMQMQHAIGELKAGLAEAKKANEKVESIVRSDFRWTWSGIAAATVLLMGALIAGYFRLEDHQDAVNSTLSHIEAKVDVIASRPAAAPPLPSVKTR